MIGIVDGPWAYRVGRSPAACAVVCSACQARPACCDRFGPQLTMLLSNYDAALSRVSSRASCTGEGEVPTRSGKNRRKRRSQSGVLVGITKQTRGVPIFLLTWLLKLFLAITNTLDREI
jgi:hypothetical protein